MVKPLFIFAIFLTYLLQFYVPALIFGRLMMKIPCHRAASPQRQSVYRKLMRASLVLLTCAIWKYYIYLKYLSSQYISDFFFRRNSNACTSFGPHGITTRCHIEFSSGNSCSTNLGNYSLLAGERTDSLVLRQDCCEKCTPYLRRCIFCCFRNNSDSFWNFRGYVAMISFAYFFQSHDLLSQSQDHHILIIIHFSSINLEILEIRF